MSIMVQVSQKCYVNLIWKICPSWFRQVRSAMWILYGRYVHHGSGKPEVLCESYMEDMSIVVQVSQKCHVNLIWKICPSGIMVQVSQKYYVNLIWKICPSWFRLTRSAMWILYGRYVHCGSGKSEVPCKSYMKDMSIVVQVSQKCHVNLIWKICPSWFR
jgi:ribosomal protein L31